MKLDTLAKFPNIALMSHCSFKIYYPSSACTFTCRLSRYIKVLVDDHSLFSSKKICFQRIKEIAKRDFRDYNSFLAVFLSHGENGKVLMKSGVMDIQEQILKPFRGNNCPTLSERPKIFIIQVGETFCSVAIQ